MRVWLNEVSLTEAVPLAIIRNVYENEPEAELLTGERPGSSGLRVLGQKRTQLTVRVEVVIREIHDLSIRRQAIKALCAWAQPGRLTLSNHPDEYLECVVVKRPALGTDRDYTQTFVVELAAIACPYWQARFPVSASGAGESGTVTLRPDGTVDRLPLSFTVTAQAALTAFSASVNGKTISLSGLELAEGDALRLYYRAGAPAGNELVEVLIIFIKALTKTADAARTGDVGELLITVNALASAGLQAQSILAYFLQQQDK